MEVAVGEPETILDLDVDITLIFQECNGSDPVPNFEVVVKGGHLFLWKFGKVYILALGLADFGFRNGGSWPIHLNYLNDLICSYNF